MISPQASIPRLLTSMYDEDTSCPKILLNYSQPISRRFLAELISLSCTMPQDGQVKIRSFNVTCSNLTSQQDKDELPTPLIPHWLDA